MLSVMKSFPKSKKFLSSCNSINWKICHNDARLSTQSEDVQSTAKIRNIGILAHIDAGKTTTTERMLFYSGRIRSMGEVHHGNTITDYMEQERSRGITITSASVSFPWKSYHINLVDTPGHIDFTMEVEQTLSVIDGAVVILDASAGVEAQTQTVWRQADHYKIPRIVYANKMDRKDASLRICIKTLQERLSAKVLPIQIPINDNSAEFKGVIDLITLEKLLWTNESLGGSQFSSLPLEKKVDPDLWRDALNARGDLVDQLSGLDDKLAEEVIAQESLDKVSATSIASALRRVTILQKGVPLLCGSSYKNKGVQPLMDAVMRYLPSPLERSNKLFQEAFKDRLCAHAFKVVHNTHKDTLVFLRIYSGQLSKGSKVYNTRLKVNEQISRIYLATADDFEDVGVITSGNIGAVTGLNMTKTGDIISESHFSVTKASKFISKQLNISEKEAEDGLGRSLKIPEPVFFCSIEAPSQTRQVALDKALEKLQREDPSLVVTYNEETSQTILGGMGELHLEIIKDRIKKEYDLDVLVGPLEIAYKEILNNPVMESIDLNHTIGKSKQKVEIRLSVVPNKNSEPVDLLTLRADDKSEQESLQNIFPNIVKAMEEGAKSGLLFGPKLCCPLTGAHIVVHKASIARSTSPSMISAAVSQCVRKALEKANTSLLEPVMLVEVVTCNDKMSAVLSDLSQRNGSVIHIDIRYSTRIVQAKVPLAQLLGYSSTLRNITSGTATFTMEFLTYEPMCLDRERKIIKRETGFL